LIAGFKIIEEGAFADFEFEARAESVEELFAVCGKAVFEAMTDLSKIELKETIKFEVEGASLEDLLFAFLAELIYLKDVKKIFFREFNVEIEGSYKLKCAAKGESIDRGKHDLRTDVKAVTYHKLKVAKNDCGFNAHVILDL